MSWIRWPGPDSAAAGADDDGQGRRRRCRGGGDSQRLHRHGHKDVHSDEMPFALLYFTGSGYFNRLYAWAEKAKG